MTSVSGNRPAPTDKHAPLSQPGKHEVGLAVVRPSEESPQFVNCSCGWTYGHTREKPREDAIDRHINKRHNGRGIRL